ncbi:MAG: septal ring lytic transglycosylase RlpA family protein [Microcoleaceae cyanobacterium]
MKYAFLGSLIALSLAPVGLTQLRQDEQVQANGTTVEESNSVSDAAPTPEVTPSLETSEAGEAVKVGEYQSEATAAPDAEAIATIYTHELEQSPAATLYIRDIPFLTFISPAKFSDGDDEADLIKLPEHSDPDDHPVARASALAAQLNRLHRHAVDPNTIEVSWDDEQERYVIEMFGEQLVAMDSRTQLPDTTDNVAEDALQATNRLRRLLGNAPPLTEIANAPQPEELIARNPVYKVLEGVASWYGSGFHGRLTANGEIYNQYEMTAAHRSLPFGTEVRVTNQDTGLSTVVRINDRGPYISGRIIDLSAAAAQAIGLANTGIAPVTVEILTPVQ